VTAALGTATSAEGVAANTVGWKGPKAARSAAAADADAQLGLEGVELALLLTVVHALAFVWSE
jgi:hypothetical protein